MAKAKRARHPEPGSRRATISDVAREAGVSKTSVSRYLGGELEVLSENMRRDIGDAITRLGYQPSQMARGLKRGRTRLIGMLVADVLNPYTVAVLHGAEAACQQHGYTLILCNTANSEEREQQALGALRSYSVEGLIVNTQGRNVKPVNELARSGLPVVLVDRKLTGFNVDMVGLDNMDAARQATLHLIEQGFEEIAFVSEPLRGVSSRQEREASFRLTLAGNPDCLGQTIEVNLDDPAALDSALQSFATPTPRRRRALFAVNGVVTLQIALSLQRLGITFPNDIGLLGFDELPWSGLVGVGITTVAQPTFDIGYAAIECLLARLDGERSDHRNILFKGQLLARGSTVRPATDGLALL